MFHFNRNLQHVITRSARNVSKFVFNRQALNLKLQIETQETHASSSCASPGKRTKVSILMSSEINVHEQSANEASSKSLSASLFLTASVISKKSTTSFFICRSPAYETDGLMLTKIKRCYTHSQGKKTCSPTVLLSCFGLIQDGGEGMITHKIMSFNEVRVIYP